MHEILHFQLGPTANHTGTHQWNIRESLFSYSDKDTDYGVAHDIDWRQGLGRQNEETYMPRLILCDLKENFGALPNINALYGTTDEENEELFEGPAEKLQKLQTTPSIPPSIYQTYLDSDHPEPSSEETDQEEDQEAGEESIPQPPQLSQTRYWSDYNRVYYHPRTLHPLPSHFIATPDPAVPSSGFASWGAGLQAWSAIKAQDQMENDFRLFAEESDLLQGVQIGLDLSTGFGAIGAGVVEEFVKEEYPKGEVIITGFMGGLGDSGEEASSISRTFTESQTLLTLLQADTTVLPIQPPQSTWLPSVGSPPTLFQSSALLAAHLTSVFMPLRTKVDRLGMTSLRGGLNWRGDTRLCELSGYAPIWDVQSAGKAEPVKFSSAGEEPGSKTTPFFAHSVLRGVPESEASTLFETLQTRIGLKGPLFTTHTFPLPLPLASPFPSIFDGSPASVPLWSTLSTTTSSRHLLSSLSGRIEMYLSYRGDMRLTFMGESFGRDEGRELLEGLWGLREGFMEDDGEESEGERE